MDIKSQLIKTILHLKKQYPDNKTDDFVVMIGHESDGELTTLNLYLNGVKERQLDMVKDVLNVKFDFMGMQGLVYTYLNIIRKSLADELKCSENLVSVMARSYDNNGKVDIILYVMKNNTLIRELNIEEIKL